jgi:hypothetical protein
MMDDEVVPFRFWDRQDVVQKIVMEFTFRFDDILDTGKLKSSLERLLEIGEWRGLGARFKKNVSCEMSQANWESLPSLHLTNTTCQAAGKLEYHIPKRYTAERPGFSWSQEAFDQRIGDHPHAARIPTSLDLRRPTLFPSSEIFHDLVTSPGHASKFSDWIETDLPALSIHVVSFEDATLLTLSWSHVFLDAMGRQGLFNAWISVLNGREDEVPPFVPLRIDPAHDIAQEGRAKSHVLYDYALKGIWFIFFIVGYVYEILMHSAETGRMVCLPGHWVENLRQQAIADVVANNDVDEKVFLSHGDVLLAWWAKVSVAAQNLSSSQPVNIMNVTNFRGLFPEHHLPADGAVFTSNANCSTNTLITSGELARVSVGDLALRLRQDLQRQRTPEQARHLIAWQIESKDQHNRLPLVGPWNQIMLAWSNWHRAKFFDLDFSAAVVRPGTPLESRSNKLGQPSLILPNGHTNGLSIRNAGPLVGRDPNGNWWLQFVLRANAWTQVEEQFQKL